MANECGLRWVSRLRALVFCVLLGLFANGAFGHGFIDERIAAVSVALGETPDSVSLLLERSSLYEQHGDWALALKDLHRARDLAPKDDGYAVQEGRILLASGAAAEALPFLRRAVASAPAASPTRLRLVRCLQQLNRPAEAEQQLRTLLNTADPVSMELLDLMVQLQRSQGHLAAALTSLDQYGAKCLAKELVLELRYQLLVELKRDHDAVTIIDQLLRLQPESTPWQLRKAQVLLRLNRINEASDSIKLAEGYLKRLPYRLRKTPFYREQLQFLQQLKSSFPQGEHPQ